MMVRWTSVLVALAALIGLVASQKYYGKRLGSLKTLEHGVKGDIYAVDSRTIHIQNFNYDGQGPDAFFYVGSGSRPSGSGYLIPDENGSTEPLKAYRNKDITLTLPNTLTLDQVQWISVWCRAYSVDFGNLILARPVSDYPRPQRLGPFQTVEHDVSSGDVVAVDAQTLLIPEFTYDGEGPDAHFWVGKGSKPGADGTLVPDENGSQKPLRRYNRKTVVITLPGQLTVFDIDYLSVWCKSFYADFGHVKINRRSLNVPPSLNMLGVHPQSKLNCEVLDDELALEIRWAVAGESVVMQLVSKMDDGHYMAFGPSGDDSRSVMIGGDVVVTWLDRSTGQGYAYDYFLESKSQCAGGHGACPDKKLKGGKNGLRLLNSALINGFSMLTFQRPLAAADRLDRPIYTNQSQAVIWAVGPLNSAGETSYHSKHVRGDLLMDFGRTPVWNCPVHNTDLGSPPSSAARAPASSPPLATVAWEIPPIPCDEPEDRIYYAQIGPTGGDSGYSAITGRVGWGVSWYINGLLIPEINVVRGQTYTFVVEGGLDPERPAKFHPFYITDDPEGGYEYKTDAERQRVRVFAGVGLDRSGRPEPTAVGRLCEWHEDPDLSDEAFDSFGSYQRTLKLNCEEGQPGILQWTPDENTPDTVYYQCYTHRYLGWKINVVDGCGPDGSSSSRTPSAPSNSIDRVDRVIPDVEDYDYIEDIQLQPSLFVKQTALSSPQSGSQRVRAPQGQASGRVPKDPSGGRPSTLQQQQRLQAERHVVQGPGFDFHDFPPGFSPPDLPPAADGMPIPRPAFNFGDRIRTKDKAGVSLHDLLQDKPAKNDQNSGGFSRLAIKVTEEQSAVTGQSQKDETAQKIGRPSANKPSLPGGSRPSKPRRPLGPQRGKPKPQTKPSPSEPKPQPQRKRRPTTTASPPVPSQNPSPFNVGSRAPTQPSTRPTQDSRRTVQHSSRPQPQGSRPQPQGSHSQPTSSRPQSQSSHSQSQNSRPRPQSSRPQPQSSRPQPQSSHSQPTSSRPQSQSNRPQPQNSRPQPQSSPPQVRNTVPPPQRSPSHPPPLPSPQPIRIPPSTPPPTSRPVPVFTSTTRRAIVAPSRNSPAPVVFSKPLTATSSIGSFPQPVRFQTVQSSPPVHGFDHSQIVFETGFKPVKYSDENNPPLAFEVNDVDASESGRVESTAVKQQSLTPSPGEHSGFKVAQFGSADSIPQAVNIPLPVSVVPVVPPDVKRKVQEEEPQVITLSQPPPPSPEEQLPERQEFTQKPQLSPHQPEFHQQQQQPAFPQQQQQQPGFPQQQQLEFQQHAGFQQQQQQQQAVPLPPHLTSDLLADAIVFSPGEDPRRPFPGRGRPPFRRQQRPPVRRPGGFLGGLLNYLPSLGGAARPQLRRRPPPPPAPAGFSLVNRVLDTGRAESQRPDPDPEVTRGYVEEPQPAHLLTPPRHHQAPLTAPQMQPMFEQNQFRPSPIDGASFRPVSDPPPPSPQPVYQPGTTESSTQTDQSTTYTSRTEPSPAGKEQSNGAIKEHILADIWNRMQAKRSENSEEMKMRFI